MLVLAVMIISATVGLTLGLVIGYDWGWGDVSYCRATLPATDDEVVARVLIEIARGRAVPSP